MLGQASAGDWVRITPTGGSALRRSYIVPELRELSWVPLNHTSCLLRVGGRLRLLKLGARVKHLPAQLQFSTA